MEAGVPIGAQPYPDPDDVKAEATVLRMLTPAQTTAFIEQVARET
jgi:hypothetical protein